jgi:hypothetical protein
MPTSVAQRPGEMGAREKVVKDDLQHIKPPCIATCWIRAAVEQLGVGSTFWPSTIPRLCVRCPSVHLREQSGALVAQERGIANRIGPYELVVDRHVAMRELVTEVDYGASLRYARKHIRLKIAEDADRFAAYRTCLVRSTSA